MKEGGQEHKKKNYRKKLIKKKGKGKKKEKERIQKRFQYIEYS
jgi:hypothetical protein